MNRAAEGLRTLEEFTRFVLNDLPIASETKALRHSLAEIAQSLDRRMLLESRDTQGDVGTTNKTAAELERSSIAAVVLAASQRVQQSLRCLEEYGKIVCPLFASGAESLRYRSYDLLAKMERKAMETDARKLPTHPTDCSHSKLYVLVDCRLPIDEFVMKLQTISEAGVDWIQIRDKQSDSRQLLAYTKAAIASLNPSKTQVIVNDRLDIALATGAAGVHFGQEDISIQDARRLVPKSMWIGISTHTLQQALQAQSEGADYIGCGPTFPSTTKSFDQYQGVEWLKVVAAKISIPAFAIGGVNESNVDLVLQAGIRRIAVSGAVWASIDPATSARQIREKL